MSKSKWICAAVVAIACALPSFGQDAAQQFFNPGHPPEGMARVYVFREKRFKGGGSKPYVNLRGIQYYPLENGTYFKVDIPPGPLEISCDNDFFVYDILDLDVVAGQTIYIAPAVRPDVMGAHWEPKQINERLALKYLAKIKEGPAVALHPLDSK